MSSEAQYLPPEVLANPEAFEKGAFYRGHLARVQAAAENREYTPLPIVFMGAIEQETEILHGEAARLIVEHPEDPNVKKYLEQTKLIIPENYRPLENVDEELAAFRQEATEYIKALAPANSAEEQKKRSWLRCIPDLGIPDLINFKLYQEFSEPTLGDPAPKGEATFGELEAASKEDADTGNWLEFRFGNSPYQVGWYDNPNIAEYRLRPADPVTASERKEIIQKRFIELAGEYGCLLTQGNDHLHLSAFEQTSKALIAPVFGQDRSLQKVKVIPPQYRSLLGSANDRRETNTNALAGVMSAVKAGAWMHKTSTEDLFLYRSFDESLTSSELAITEERDGIIRVLPNRYELRPGKFKASPSQGFLWMMAGIIDGYRKGADYFAKFDGSAPEYEDSYQVERTNEYVKEYHIGMQRALENSKPIEGGGFALDSGYNFKVSTRGSERITGCEVTIPVKEGEDIEGYGRRERATTYVLNKVALMSLRTNEEGGLYATKETVRTAYDELGDLYARLVEVPIDDAAIATLANFITHKARGMRLKKSRVLHSNVHFWRLPPRDRYYMMGESGAMEIAYGKDADAYSSYLCSLGLHTYRTAKVDDELDARIRSFMQ